MRRPLIRHPASPCDAVRTIAAEANRPAPGRLALSYELAADPAGLLVPQPAAPARTDELWKHTCLEAFVRAPGAEAYLELNLAPSGQWAGYRFNGYRAGMTAADEVGDPHIAWTRTADGFELAAEIDLSRVALLPADGPWRLSLTAVIEEANGRTSYWALAHPPGRPDFHHSDGFVLDLIAS
jgi:hypothetical protein